MEWTPTYPRPSGLDAYPAVGGGDHYKGCPSTHEEADYVARTRDQLQSALSNVNTGEMVRVAEEVNLSGVRRIPISTAGVTLAGDRGQNDPGALVGSTNSGDELFRITARDVRVTGLRFQGVGHTYDAEGYGVGVRVSAPGAEIDNCAFRGFGYAGVLHGQNKQSGYCEVHHNTLIDCPRQGLGYGAAVYNGLLHAHHNYGNYCRHVFAGGGQERCRQILEDNYLGPQANLHPLDMHMKRKGGGQWLKYRHNIVELQESVDTRGNNDGHQSGSHIRGRPREASAIRNNAFGNEQSEGYDWGDAIECSRFEPPGPITIEGNQFANATPESESVGIRPDDGSRDGDGNTSDDPTMSYPTSDWYGKTYDVVLRGTGNKSDYSLTAADKVTFPKDEERQEQIEGRTATGRLTVAQDTVRCTGPITALTILEGDEAIDVEIGDRVFSVSDFPDIEKDGGHITGNMRFDGKAFEVTVEVEEL